jgi:MFS family permease
VETISLIPYPDAIPLHWAWFHVFLTATFVLHLVFMNAMLGIGMIALSEYFMKKNANDGTEKDISRKLPYLIAFTVNMGVAPLLFLQVLYGNLIYTSSIFMAWYWISVVPLLLIAYYFAYIYDFKFHALGRFRGVFIGLAVLFMLFIAFLFSNNMTLMLTPEKWIVYFENPRGTFLNLSEPILWPRYFHFVAASIAVGSLFLAILAEKKTNGRSGRHLRRFAYATLVQMGIGIWFLLFLPQEIMLLFMGKNIPATLFFLSGLFAAVLSVLTAFNGKSWLTAGFAAATIILMVLMRDVVRKAYLSPWFDVSRLTVTPQYSPLILFLGVLGVTSFMVGYMLIQACKAKKEVA